MRKKSGREVEDNLREKVESIVKDVVTEVSLKVQKSYEMIDLSKVPDHVNYAKVEKYLRSLNIEITRKMFLSYLKDGLLPGGHEVKNANFSYYTKEQILYYILVDMFKPILPLNKIKVLFNITLKPIIEDMGVEATYKTLYTIVLYMTHKFEESVSMVINENISTMKNFLSESMRGTSVENAVVRQNIEQYTNLVTLCMSRGAFDFYKYSPNTLIDLE